MLHPDVCQPTTAYLGLSPPMMCVVHTASDNRGHASGGETPKLVGRKLRRMYITRGDLPLQKTIFCLATLLSRLLMLRSAVRGLRLIATSRRGARDLSCSHGGDCAARKVRASASEVKDGGGYGHPLTHGPVFQRDKRIIAPRAQSERSEASVAARGAGYQENGHASSK